MNTYQHFASVKSKPQNTVHLPLTSTNSFAENVSASRKVAKPA